MVNGASNVQFCVSGVAIRPEFQDTTLYVPTRKFYNAKYFHDERYRHEIANHYRDFKLRPRLRRRKRGYLMCSYGKPPVTPSIRREMPYEYLPELPMAVQELPRFDREHTPPPGRQRHLCDEKRQDLVCNDTLQRIQKAAEENDTEKLKHFARQHLERNQRFESTSQAAAQWKRRPRKAANVYQSLEKCDKWYNDEVKDLQKPTANKTKYRRRSLGNLESVDEQLTRHHQQQQLQRQRRQPQEFPFENDCGVAVIRAFPSNKRSFVLKPESTTTTTSANRSKSRGRVNTLTYYLQLATDYYEQGFLSNIKYLENLGERNQLRRKQDETLRQSTSTNRCTNECTSASSLTRTESRITAVNAPQYEGVDSSNDNSGICNPILKIIAKKHSFRIYRYNEKEREHPDICNSAHWPIRVQIKPVDSTNSSSSVAALTQQTNGTGNDSGNSKSSKIPSHLSTPEHRNSTTTNNKDCCYSMNDYLNGNLQLQQAPNTNYHQLTSFHHHNYPAAKELLIDTLIDNLKELEIDEHPIHLPRITLSDCSSHRYPPTEDYTTSTPLPTSPIPSDVDTSLLSGKRCLNSILLRRQESIDLSANNLDLPLESLHYQSEARPP